MARLSLPFLGRKSNAQVAATTEKSVIVSGESLHSYIRPGQAGYETLPIDDIITRYGYKEYVKMRQDAQVKAALNFKKILVYARGFDLKPADDSPEAEEIASFVMDQFKRVKIKRIMREALTALDFGSSFGEKLWELQEWEGGQVIGLKNVKFRYPKSFKVMTDTHGNVTGFVQNPYWGNRIEFAPEKIFHFVHNKEFQDHYGQPDLRAVYKNWWAKKFIINFWNVHLEKIGSPLTAVKYPQGAGEEMKAALKTILTNLQAKTEILVPEGVEIDILESLKAGNTSFEDALLYHDGEIAKGILVPALLGFGSKSGPGPDSLSRLQLRTLFKVAQDLGDHMSEEMTDQLIKPLVDFNYDSKLYPEFIWADYGEFEAAEIADSIRLLHNAGIIDMDQEDVNYARGVVGLPIRDEGDEDEVLRPNPAPQGANMPPAAAPQGNDKGTTETKGNAE